MQRISSHFLIDHKLGWHTRVSMATELNTTIHNATTHVAVAVQGSEAQSLLALYVSRVSEQDRSILGRTPDAYSPELRRSLSITK